MCVPTSADASILSGGPNLYDVLGVSIKATAEEIRLSYLKLARLWHPDRHGGAEAAKRKFQQIQCAYEVLSNERRRAHYDLKWLDLLDVEDYLDRYKGLILTVSGLGLSMGSLACCAEQGNGPAGEGEWCQSSALCRSAVEAA